MFVAFTYIKLELVQAHTEVLLIDTNLIVEEVDPHILVILRVIILAQQAIALLLVVEVPDQAPQGLRCFYHSFMNFPQRIKVQLDPSNSFLP